MDLNELSLSIQSGRIKKVKELVQMAIEKEINPEKILNEGMINAMGVVGSKFKDGEIFVPEMLVAAKAMAGGLEVLEPVLTAAGVRSVGKAVIGTVAGDLHDIGKNLVRMMLKGSGVEVVDLGIDVSAAAFVDKAEELGADIICLSALLTTTMPVMKKVIDELNVRGIRNKYKVMVGGAPVNEGFCNEIGADAYAPDAATAAETAIKLLTA